MQSPGHCNRWGIAGALAIAAIVILAAIGASCQILAEWHESHRFPPPGVLVDVGGRRLHAICTGAGAPGVLLEASALGISLQYAAAQAEISTTHRVCSYDRAGLGWSDSSPGPATARSLELDLEHLLQAVDLPSPSIFVASSAGGLDVELYAREHPERVAGLVWVDALSGAMLDQLPQLYRLERSACAASAAAWLGVIRLIDPLRLESRASADAARR